MREREKGHGRETLPAASPVIKPSLSLSLSLRRREERGERDRERRERRERTMGLLQFFLSVSVLIKNFAGTALHCVCVMWGNNNERGERGERERERERERGRARERAAGLHLYPYKTQLAGFLISPLGPVLIEMVFECFYVDVSII